MWCGARWTRWASRIARIPAPSTVPSDPKADHSFNITARDNRARVTGSYPRDPRSGWQYPESGVRSTLLVPSDALYAPFDAAGRSEERRVGKECRRRWGEEE